MCRYNYSSTGVVVCRVHHPFWESAYGPRFVNAGEGIASTSKSAAAGHGCMSHIYIM